MKAAIILILPLVYAIEFPKQFERCKQNDPNFDTCLKKAVQSAVTLLKNGLPEYSMVSLDPLNIPKLTIGAGPGAVHLEQNYQDLKCHGISTLVVSKAHFDFKNKILKLTTLGAEIILKGKYNINGKVMILPVYGAGDTEIIIQNATLHHLITFEEVKKKDKIYLEVKNYDIELLVEHVSFNFANLFNGQKILGDPILKLVNENWQIIFYDIKMGYEKAFSEIFKGYVVKIFNKISIDEIFPAK